VYLGSQLDLSGLPVRTLVSLPSSYKLLMKSKLNNEYVFGKDKYIFGTGSRSPLILFLNEKRDYVTAKRS
jgi:hypothetical protein